MVQKCDCKVVAESQRVVVDESSHSRGTIIPVLLTSASTAIWFVACRCSTAMLALWSACEVDLPVQRSRNETQLQAMNTAIRAVTLLQTFIKSSSTLLQLGSSAVRFCGWWIRATAMSCVILPRTEPKHA